VSTTKLTRKEISADPIHDALIRTIETLRASAKLIAVTAAGVIVILLGVYFGLRYLNARDLGAQRELAKGMDYYHAMVDPAKAKDDPYASGTAPLFRSEEAKYRAAGALFSPLATRFGSSKIGVIARYYQGLCQDQLGQKNEAVASLEAVANNTSDRTVAFLAKKVLAQHYVANGDPKKAQDILQAMLKDPQCDLPREDLLVDTSRALMAQGKRAEALKTLEEAQATGAGGMLQSLVFQELSRIQETPGK
jgi:tetratricopeptide (TPR) repeat protein